MTERDSSEPEHYGESGLLTDAYARWRSRPLGRITDDLQQRLLLEVIGAVEGLDVLDVGCGEGALATALATRGAQVTGLDADPQMIAAAQARAAKEAASLRLVLGQVEELPFPDASFDCVTATAVLCFVSEAQRAVSEMARVLRPDGQLVIGELGRWNAWAARRRIQAWLGNTMWAVAHFRTATDLRSLMHAGGLTVGQTRGATFYPPFDVAASVFAEIDPWLGTRTTCGAAFIVLSADKQGTISPSLRSSGRRQAAQPNQAAVSTSRPAAFHSGNPSSKRRT